MARHHVGSRELKVRLGTYLRRVREGQTLVVTDRGQPIAELRPIAEHSGTEAVLARLEARGVVTRPTAKKLAWFRPIERRSQPLSTAVLDDRKDRVE